MNLLRQIHDTRVTPELVVMLLCVLLGAFVLTKFSGSGAFWALR